jgi:hypothetical protein
MLPPSLLAIEKHFYTVAGFRRVLQGQQEPEPRTASAHLQ